MCPAEAVFDGHSVLLVGYRDEASQGGAGIFLFRNTANDGRDGSMPYTYARSYMNDAVWIDGPEQAKPGQ
jgi:C1A family cysteine protease